MPAPRSPRLMIAACLVSATIGFAALPAQAADYAGTWAADLAQCKTGQDSQDAPLVLTAKGYDQAEAHCTFDGLKSSGAGEWSGKAACSIEGDQQSIDVTLTVSGDTLTLTEDGAARDLLRCP
jgi:hypothetical protein